MIFSKNNQFLLKCLVHFWDLHQIFDILKKKMIIPLADVFPKLRIAKDAVR